MEPLATVRVDLGSLAQAGTLAGPALGEALRAGIWEASLLLQREIKEATPTASNALRGSFIADEPTLAGDVWLGVVGSSIAHAVPVELGTKPHWAPLQPLIDWVRQKLAPEAGAAGEDREAVIEGIARRVQFAIAARGTLGVGMVSRTFARYQGPVANRIAARVRRALEGLA